MRDCSRPANTEDLPELRPPLSYKNEAKLHKNWSKPRILGWQIGEKGLIPKESCRPERSLAHRERRSRTACPGPVGGTCSLLTATLLLALWIPYTLPAQTASPHAFATTAPSPTSTRTYHDPNYHLSFDYPANWTFSHADGEISTFHLDARSAARKTLMRAVVAMPENPFPESTFSGAYVYFSVTPHASADSCAAQASNTTVVKNTPQTKPGQSLQIATILFTHGHDEVKDPARRDLHHSPRRRLLPLRPRHQQLLRRRSLQRQRHHPRRTRPGPHPPHLYPQHDPLRPQIANAPMGVSTVALSTPQPHPFRGPAPETGP